MKLVVFCVESDKKARTDDKYIDKAIREYYVIDNNIKIAYAHMNGKGNFDKKFVINDIKRQFSGDFDEKHVVYCIDIDNQADSDVIDLNKRIKEYCDNLHYDLVWFCRDIEEVFLHKSVNKSDKIVESDKFRRTQGLGKASKNMLSSKSATPRHSNLLNVLNNFMTKKN